MREQTPLATEIATALQKEGTMLRKLPTNEQKLAFAASIIDRYLNAPEGSMTAVMAGYFAVVAERDALTARCTALEQELGRVRGDAHGRIHSRDLEIDTLRARCTALEQERDQWQSKEE